ncbi:MAG TPA: 3-dehydroquinate synthase [Myxococcota bacterium]|nr:3-dehydroquinate synthase [Myxococcota bacterium]
MTARVLTLVGLMGAGKSTLGRALAAQLNWPFVDLDTEIERRHGSIISIFEIFGEAHFRALERQVLTDLLTGPVPFVLATGGGTPCQPGLMDLLLEMGPVLWLDAPLDTLLERAAADHLRGHGRPLLLNDGVFSPSHARARLAALLESRRPYYARGHRIDAARPLAVQLADALTLTPEPPMLEIPTPPSASLLEVALAGSPPHRYPIHLTPELPGQPLAALVANLVPRPLRALVVTDTHVAPLYADAALSTINVQATLQTVPHGEQHKTIETALSLVDTALNLRLSRTDLFIALGGGVIGDLTGFAAAITQRGLRVVQVPTTLLAQVDSSVGGKTGVNHSRGKNLIGAFWQPVGVVASQAVLKTLPAREVRCGLAEAVKHAFIADPALLDFILDQAAALRALAPVPTAHLVQACCRIKAEVVAADEREDPVDGRRAILNFGHTFGHAFENLLGYGALTHGEAVSLGMVLAARLSDRLGVSRSLEPRVTAALTALHLPHDPLGPDRPTLGALIEAARGDKKALGAEVRFVLLTDIGDPVVTRLAWSDIARHLADPGGPT